MDDDPPPPLVRRQRFVPSLVWVVPIVAVVAGIVLGTRAWLGTGPQVTIAFHTAEGLEPGRTEVRYKEVVVGRVNEVELSPDRRQVLVGVSLERSAADLAVEDTRFWVVRPRVGAGGITGLGTIFSGAYIGVDAGVSQTPRRRFTGLEAPPFFLRGEPGRVFVLDARELGSLDLGSPVYYRGARVGRVVGYNLDPSHDALNVQVFIEAPNEPLVTTASRFWNASGIDVSLDAGGVSVSTESLTSVLAGGVAFANPTGAPSAQPAGDNHQFRLHRTRKEALAPADGPPVRIRTLFERAPHGLAIEAPVVLLGLEIGSVTAVELQYDQRRRRFVTQVEAEIHPARLGPARDQMLRGQAPSSQPDAAFVQRLVDAGLRAQVRTGSLLTGQLYVALDIAEGAPKAAVDHRPGETVAVPSVPAPFEDVQQQAAEIVKRLSRVEFDRIAADVRATLRSARETSGRLQRVLDNADAAISRLSPEAQQALAELRRTLSAANEAIVQVERNVARPDAPLQHNANQALSELQRAARALRVLGEYLQQHPESLLRGKPADRALEVAR